MLTTCPFRHHFWPQWFHVLIEFLALGPARSSWDETPREIFFKGGRKRISFKELFWNLFFFLTTFFGLSSCQTIKKIQYQISNFFPFCLSHSPFHSLTHTHTHTHTHFLSFIFLPYTLSLSLSMSLFHRLFLSFSLIQTFPTWVFSLLPTRDIKVRSLGLKELKMLHYF